MVGHGFSALYGVQSLESVINCRKLPNTAKNVGKLKIYHKSRYDLKFLEKWKSSSTIWND